MYIRDGSLVVIINEKYKDHRGKVGIWTNPPAGWDTGEVEGVTHIRVYPEDIRPLGYNDRIAL